MSEASELFREWIGRQGLPPPLDIFLSRRRASGELFRALGRAAAWAATSAAALSDRIANDREQLLTDLRRLPPEEILSAADAAAGLPAPKRIARAVETCKDQLSRSMRWDERAVARGVPAGWGPVLARRASRWGSGNVDRWLDAQSSRPPLWVRPRDEAAVAALRDEGFRVEPETDGSAKVTSPRGIETSRAFREGQIEVQDRASQRVGALAMPRPGQIVWDMCAGRGGKTVLLAHGLAGRGALHASDIDERKLPLLKQRIRRAGLAGCVRVHHWDGRERPPFGPEARRGFDIVLIDAPCSASGTWRRNPDARLRIDPRDLGRFTETQRGLLLLGASALRPGGRLVYTTCSLSVEECEEVAGTLGEADCALHGPPDLDSDTLFGAVLAR